MLNHDVGKGGASSTDCAFVVCSASTRATTNPRGITHGQTCADSYDQAGNDGLFHQPILPLFPPLVSATESREDSPVCAVVELRVSDFLNENLRCKNRKVTVVGGDGPFGRARTLVPHEGFIFSGRPRDRPHHSRTRTHREIRTRGGQPGGTGEGQSLTRVSRQCRDARSGLSEAASNGHDRPITTPSLDSRHPLGIHCLPI